MTMTQELTKQTGDLAEAQAFVRAMNRLGAKSVTLHATGNWTDAEGNIAFCDGRQEINLLRRGSADAMVDGSYTHMTPDKDSRKPGEVIVTGRWD
jgi:hypothetical protein